MSILFLRNINFYLMKNLTSLYVSGILCLSLLLSLASQTLGQGRGLELKYLGTAGWVITDGQLVILIDPYVSRLKLSDAYPEDKRKTYNRSDYYEPDTSAINRIINKADYILVHHSHFDHLSDVPYIVKKTGAKVIGTETTCNILRAYGIGDNLLYEVRGGEDYQFDGMSVRVIPSIHSPLNNKHYYNSEVYSEVPKAPLKIGDFIEGGSLMFLVRFGSKEILTMGSMNFVEREISGLKPDVLLAGANLSRNENYKYTARLLTATNFPKVVIPTHWDNFRVPYGFSQEEPVNNRLKPFIEEVKAVSAGSKVIIPKHLETISIR